MNESKPQILSAELKLHGVENVPYLVLNLAEHPDGIQKLEGASQSRIYTEIWMRKEGDKDFIKVGDIWGLLEKGEIDIRSYYGGIVTNVEAAAYEVKARYSFDSRYYFYEMVDTTTYYSDYSNVIKHNMPAWEKASDWAVGELKKAQQQGLIPDSLVGGDFTKAITRREFAAVAVKLYENLSGKKAVAAATNPFTDTKDAEVLKAYNTDLMVGTAPDKFSPDVILDRQTAATALTRVLKKCYIDGWTYATDSSFTLNFTMPSKFKDDARISPWAYQSVYFMAANNVIKGNSDGTFAPRATTTAEQAIGYGNNTREQALVIAVRIVENLKDKPLSYN
jgi:hypothetical protein